MVCLSGYVLGELYVLLLIWEFLQGNKGQLLLATSYL